MRVSAGGLVRVRYAIFALVSTFALAACDAILGDFTLTADAGGPGHDATTVDARSDVTKDGPRQQEHVDATTDAGHDAGHAPADAQHPYDAGVDAAKSDATEKDAGMTKDTGPSCPAPEIICVAGGACVNPEVDPDNCGGCGHSCLSASHVDPTKTTCSGGHCAFVCAPGFSTPCDAGAGDDAGCPTSLATTEHCGACGTSCASPKVCATDDGGASCASSCANGLTQCAGACVNTKTDPSACGASCAACAYACFDGGCGGACTPGIVQCSDLQHTEICGSNYEWQTAVACTVTGELCANGVCACATGLSVCGGACVNEQKDNANCGGCGTTCSITGETCVNGACACATGLSACGTRCVNEQNDDSNCGKCGTSCTITGETCVNGACACATGLSVCGTKCVNEQNDTSNCGKCGKICTPLLQTCTAGSCVGL